MRACLTFALCLLSSPGWANFGLSPDSARPLYLDLVRREAILQGVPPALADAVAMVETSYHPNAVGTSGEIGLMQIMPATARQLGFTGAVADLFTPAINVHLGVQYLARAWAASGGSVCRALMKYRAGLGEETMTPLSINYCTRALSWLSATDNDLGRGTPLADAPVFVPPADPYAIAIGNAPAAGSLPHMITPQPAGFFRTYRSMAERNAALDGHVRHIPASAKVQEAVAAALAAD